MSSYTWTIATHPIECGYDGERIAAGEPVEEIRRTGLSRVLIRCQRHAHTSVDEKQVEGARLAHEAAVVPRETTMPAPRFVSTHRPKSFAAMSEIASSASLFDRRRAASGESE